jgi:hypothetical protein
LALGAALVASVAGISVRGEPLNERWTSPAAPKPVPPQKPAAEQKPAVGLEQALYLIRQPARQGIGAARLRRSPLSRSRWSVRQLSVHALAPTAPLP